MNSTFRATMAAAGLCLGSAVFAADQGKPGVTVDVTQLPAPVQAALHSEDARVDQVVQSTESGKTAYRATLSKANKNFLLTVGSDGKIIKREEMAAPQQKPN